METKPDARNAAVPTRDPGGPCSGCPHTLTNPDTLPPAVVAAYQQRQLACQKHRQALAAQGARFTNDAPLRIGDLTIDPVTHEGTRAGKPIKLRPREFAVLRILRSVPGKFFGQPELMRAVWGRQLKKGSNAVTMTMSRLHDKIDTGHDTPLIENVRWQGYRLNVDG